MPRYTYRCDGCENILEIAHSIREKLEICEECNGDLIRVPSTSYINSGQKKAKSPNKIGDLVKNHIEETRREISDEKKRISREEYK